jgi:hypothetical protein
MQTFLTFLKTIFATPKVITSVAATGTAAALLFTFRNEQFCASLLSIAIPAAVTIGIAYFIITIVRSR